MKAFPDKQLHPKDPIAKAKGRLRVEKYGKLTGNFYKVAWLPSTPEERKTNWEQLVKKLGDMDEELKSLGTTFFGGNIPEMSDYMIWPWIERLPIMVSNIQTIIVQTQYLWPS